VASSFQPFNPRGEFKATHRNLPHWHQPGATYFVTFRLADSLPVEVREQFEEMRRLNNSDTFAWMERYLDAGSGSCLFKDPEHATALASTLRHFDERHYLLGAFAVMPNHVHALVRPTHPNTLTAVLHSWKSYSANQLQRRAGITGRVWQEESFDRLVRDESELAKFHSYIVGNPVAAHLRPGTFVLGEGSANWPKLTT
jgi:REP element-mobilizing transposase RayT